MRILASTAGLRRLEADLEPVEATLRGERVTLPKFAADEIRRLQRENLRQHQALKRLRPSSDIGPSPWIEVKP